MPSNEYEDGMTEEEFEAKLEAERREAADALEEDDGLEARIVRRVLSHLYERKPFKHDLGNMEGDHPVEWVEMIEGMREDVREELLGENFEESDGPENDHRIGAFMHCGLCVQTKPSGVSPSEFQHVEVGSTRRGFQVWCKRHNCNVLHVDFQGARHPANMTRQKS